MTPQEETTEQYNEYFIKSNPVPSEQFDFGGFGWNFSVSRTEQAPPILNLVIKHGSGDHNESDRQAVKQLGLQEVHSIIDSHTGIEGYKCYWWDRATGLEEGDCAKISPKQFRSPLSR